MLLTLLLACALPLACGGGEVTAPTTPVAPAAPAAVPAAAAAPSAAGVGPDGPSSIPMTPIAAIPTDTASIAEGEKLFSGKGCAACHQFGSKLVGPDLAGLTTRRTIPWVQRMIQEPEAMTKQDPAARELFKTYMVQMTKQGISDDEMPKLIAYIQSAGG